MLQNILTTFYVGQIAFEQATEASKKSIEAAKEKAKEYKAKAEEYNREKVVEKFDCFVKERFAELRTKSEPVETTCEKLAKFLGETADLKSQLVHHL
jgi:predicted solute-binding protein